MNQSGNSFGLALVNQSGISSPYARVSDSNANNDAIAIGFIIDSYP